MLYLHDRIILQYCKKASNKEPEETQDDKEENNERNADSVVTGRGGKDNSVETNGKF